MPRCLNKNCREKFEQKRFLQKYCDKKECQIEERTQLALKNLKGIKKKKFTEMKVSAYSSKYKDELQKEINKLARMIDQKFYSTCIDCGRTLKDDVHGSHYHNVGGNENIRYNLHNIHASLGHCNVWSSGNKQGYQKGLIERYGEEYAEYIEFGIKEKYKSMHFSNNEIYEAIPVVRKSIRDFETFIFNDTIQARDQLNQIINLYK
jgi:hypothetical protein